MKMVVLDGYVVNPGDISWKGLSELGDITVYDKSVADEMVSRIGDAEIIFVNKVMITREILECTHVKYIGLFSTGYNVIDLEAANEQGIVVANVPNYSTMAVAQFTFSLLLELCHHVWEHSELVRQGEWIRSEYFTFWAYSQMELVHKHFGIIGYGNIGQRVAQIACAMGMNVLAYTRSPRRDATGAHVNFVDMNTLLRQSDVLSLHCPLTDSTHNLINRDTISQMKKGAYLLNTARGAIVDEEALANALNTDYLGGAAVDVLSQEPMHANCPLMTAKNCIITPHIAWVAKDTRSRLLEIVVNNVKQYLQGDPVNVVSNTHMS